MAIADTAKLIVDLSLKGNFASQLKTSERALGGFNAKITDSQGRWYKAGQQIGTGIKNGVKVATVALTSLAGLLLLSAKEGQHAADVQNVFNRAVSNSGKITSTYVKALNDQALALSNLTGQDDELIRSEQTRLIQMGLTGQQITKLLPLILDAAQSTGRDLDSVTLAVGRAVQGSATSLGRLGIIVPKVAAASKSAALATLEQKKALLLVDIAQAKAQGTLTKSQKAYFDHKKAVLDAAIAQQKYTDSLKKGTTAASNFDTVANALKPFQGVNQALSGSLDVKLKVLRERLQDVREEAGIKLLPALTRIVDVVGQKLVPAFGKLIDAVLPGAISELNQLADFLSKGGATDSVNRLLDTIKTLMPAITAGAQITGKVISTAVNLFKSLPPEIQGLAVAGLAVNKLTGGLVTNIAGGLISSVLKQLVSGVVNVNGAVVNVNGLPGIAGGAKGIGLLESVGLTTPVLAGLTVGVMGAVGLGTLLDAALNSKGQTFDQANQQLAKSGVTLSTTAVTTSNQLASGRQVVHAGKGASLVIVGTGTTITAPSAKLPGDASDARGLGAKLSTFTDQLGRAATGLKDDRVDLKQLQRGTLAFLADLRNYVRRAEHDLKSAKPKDLLGDIKTIRGFIVAAQHGNVAETKGALSALKAALGKTHDSKTAAILREAIRKVGDKLDYRVFVRQQLAKATAIAKSSETTKEKIADLERIQAHFVRNGDVKVAAAIGKKIDEAKRSQAYAARATTEAIKDKDLSIVNNITLPVKVQVSSRETSQTQITFKRAFGTLS